MDKVQLGLILEVHKKWVLGKGGKRANLREADLSRAYLREADLHGAYLHGSNLLGADLSGAVLGETKIIQLGPLGSRKDYLVVKRFKDGSTEAMTGCFHGSLEEFAAAVEETHKDHAQFLIEYRAAIQLCRDAWKEAV